MKKYIILIFSALMFFSACGDSVIETAQNFKPNRVPVIYGITRILPAGITEDSISNNMTIGITVTAGDPEGKPLEYSFSSESGIFGNIVKTDTGCTAELYTRNIQGGGKVYITVTATDDRKASDTWGNFNIGTGRSGPKVSVITDPKDYMKPSSDTEFVFSAASEGYYQIVCDNSAAADTISINYDGPVYMYVPSGDELNPKTVTVKVAGLTSSSSGRVKLAADNAPNKVWLIFWDGLKQYDIKCFVITQDSIPPLFSQVTPSGEDNGINSNIDIVFNENILLSSGMFEVRDSAGTDVSSRFSEASVIDNSVVLNSVSGLDYYETYTVEPAGGTVVTDLAGNEFTGTVSGTFTTQELGQLAAPVFRDLDGTAVDETYPYADSGRIIRAVYEGSEPSGGGALSVSCTTSVAGDFTIDSSDPKDVKINFKKNRLITATVNKKGCKPKETTVTVNMRCDTPVITQTGDPYAYNVYDVLFVSLPLTDLYKYSDATDGSEPADPVDDYTPGKSYSVNGSMVRIKAQKILTGWAPSEIAAIGPVRIRNKNTPAAGIVTSAEQSRLPWTGVSVSGDGMTIAAVENGSVMRGYDSGVDYNGYIWLSGNGGLDWRAVAGTGVGLNKWSSVSISSDALTIYAGCNPGDIYKCSYSAGEWSGSSIDGASHQWKSLSVASTGTLFAAMESNLLSCSSSTWSALTNPESPVIPDWRCIASTLNEKQMVSGVYNGYLYFSDDGGDSWSAVSSSVKKWTCAVSSADEQVLYAGTDSGEIYSCNLSGNLTSSYIVNLNMSLTGLGSAKSPYNTMAASVSNDYIYTTENIFSTYSAQGPRLWSSVASSPSGKHIAGAVYKGNIYVSHNNGATWSRIDNPAGGNTEWVGVAISQDGTKIAAIDTLNIYVFSGTGWVSKNPDGIQRGFTGVAISSDGNTILASASKFYLGFGTASNLWTSSDYGESWTNPVLSANQIWRGVAMSADGSVMAAISDSEFDGTNIVRVLISGTWVNQLQGIGSAGAVSVSSSGDYIAVTAKYGYIYVYNGTSWKPCPSAGEYYWKGVSIADGGNIITALSADGKIITSYDGGTSWVPQTYAGSLMWNCVAASADGLDIVAGSFGGANPVILR